MSNKKFLRPKDVEDIYSIKVSTLSKQRQWKEKNKNKKLKGDKEYKETEQGFFKEMYNGITRSKHGHQFKSYEEFI